MCLAHCESFREAKLEMGAREDLLRARELLDEGDYEGALKENRKILSCCENMPPGDEALFNIGIIYAHYGYPDRDRRKSLDFFERLVSKFPESPLARKAEIWMGLLHENGRLSGEIEELKRAIKETKLKNEELIKKIQELERAISETKRVDIEIDQKKKELSK